KGEYNNHAWFAGNKRMMDENKIVLSNRLASKSAQLQEDAKTVIYFADNKNVQAVIAVADKIKDTSAVAIQSLQQRGIEVYMLTGDNEHTAVAVAKRVGVN